MIINWFSVGTMAAHWITGWMWDSIGTFHMALAIAAMMSFCAMVTISLVRKTIN